ncbi:MAG: alpha-amylase family glycosyl hydrolase, partial [Halanaerobiales bacterium]
MENLVVKHNSFNEFYRSPPGAVPRGESLLIRIKIEAEKKPENVFLCLKGEEDLQKRFEMHLSHKEGNVFGYEVKFKTAEDTSLLWYDFYILYNNKKYYYGKKDHGYGGKGKLSSTRNIPYQITTYKPDLKTPDWFKNSVVYQIFVDRFYNGNKDNKILNPKKNCLLHSHWDNDPLYIRDEEGNIARWDFFGGNLIGVRKKLPYLKKLGINVIYFNPVFEAASNHKYDVGNYHKIDQMFGDNELFEKLVAEAEELGISIILDGVFSHTGSDSIYFNKYNNYNSQGA